MTFNNQRQKDESVEKFDTVGEFEYHDGALYKGGEQNEQILLGQVAIDAQVEMPDGSIQLLSRTKDGRKVKKVRLLNQSGLNAAKLADHLQSCGLVVLRPAPVLDFIRHLTTLVALKPTIKALESIGWHANRTVFNTGTELLCSSGVNRDAFHSLPPAKESQRMLKTGTLAEWQREIGVHIENNDVPLVFSCLSLASVMLPWAKQSSSIFNLFGTQGKGKTLCLQLASGIWGNGCDPAHSNQITPPYIRKVNGTSNGLEALLTSYSVLPAILDELGERNARDLAELCYAMASGSGKSRMKPNQKLAESNSWLLNILMSSEVSISDSIYGCGQTQMAGQADRAADIPIPPSGIFTEFDDFGSFASLSRHLKAVTGQYYGSAGRAFIKYCLDNSDHVEELFKYLFTDLTDELCPTQCDDGQKRVVMRFALSALAGIIAVDAGIFRCEHDRILEAHEKVVALWWSYRTDSVSKVLQLLYSGQVTIANMAPAMNMPANTVFRHVGFITFSRSFFDSNFSDSKKVLHELDRFGVLHRQKHNGNRMYQNYCNRGFIGYSFFEQKLTNLKV